MRISKIEESKDEYTNLVWIVNRAIKSIKEHYTEAEQDETPLEDLYFKKSSLKEVISLNKIDELLIRELFKQITENEWKPEDDEEIVEYLECRRNLILPILEEGSMEYTMLRELYNQFSSEGYLKCVIYIVMTYARVFRWKDLDYHLLDCHTSD